MAVSKSICILGMHRSGTSVITRAINLLGADLGEEKDLMAPGPYNPEGYWERNDIIALDDRILNHFKRAWNANTPLPAGWHLSSELRPLRKEIVELVNNNFRDHELWAWKDPRTTVVFDIWKDVLKELGIDLVCLFAVRNPLDVAKSLEKRDGFTRDRGYGIWFNYNIAALKASADIPRVFVSYDRFLADWETELKRCADGLGVKWPEDDSFLRDKMKEFIRPGLRHSYSGVKELKETGAPEPVIELYQLLDSIMDESVKPGPGFNKKIEELEKEFSSYARFYSDDLMRLSEFEEILAEKDRQIAGKDRQLAERDRQIQSIHNSYSWRITALLRNIMGLFKK